MSSGPATGVGVGGQGAVAVKGHDRAGKGGPVLVGIITVDPVSGYLPHALMVGVVSGAGCLSALHTSEVLAARPRAITNICVLSFIFCSFGLIWFFLFWPSLIPHREELFPAVHRSTERKSARGYAENAETLRTTDYADVTDTCLGGA